MKIGILTFPHAPSLGAMLQMGALYNVIEQAGHSPEIVNYMSDHVIHCRKKGKRKKSLKSNIVNFISRTFIKNPVESFKDFESTLKMFPEQPGYSVEMLKEVENHFDRIIVGSDQVWNPVVTGHDMNFYLKFCTDNAKKASYAASFGVSDVEEQEKPEIAELLGKFKHLAVREKQGQEIIKNLTGRDAELVLDPTLLVSADYLRSLADNKKIRKKYVLFFNIKPSPSLLEHAKRYAKKHNLMLITIGGRLADYFNPLSHPRFDVGPKEFVSLIDGAECVFTNSFHGTAVSIALHTDFFVEFSTDSNSRLINLTQILQLEDRIIKGETPAPKKIDYDKVEDKLSEYRKQSIAYLNKVLSDNE